MLLSFGVTYLDVVRQNSSGAIEAFDWHFPVYRGTKSPYGRGRTGTAKRVLEVAVYRTRGRKLPDSQERIRPDNGYWALKSWLVRQQNAVIVALGPLSVLATITFLRGELLAKIGRITRIGGGMTHGNHTKAAEFGAFADPQALQTLIAQLVQVRMIDQDACPQITTSETDVTTYAGIQGHRTALLDNLLGGYLEIALGKDKQSRVLDDPVAAAALLWPGFLVLKRPSWWSSNRTENCEEGQPWLLK